MKSSTNKYLINKSVIFHKKFWGKGYALEGAKACVNYAFSKLNTYKVIAQIRPNNFQSRKVAERLGMKIEGEYIKHYTGGDVPHS